MKIAYLILAHNDSKMLNELVKALNYKADFFIHIDAKSKMDFHTLKKIKNVYFVKRVDVRWAGYSMIEATLNLIERALEQKKDYKKLVLLSGQDYPLYSGKEIFDHLNNNNNYIRGFNIMNSGFDDVKKVVTGYFIYDIPFFKKSGILFRVVRRCINELSKLIHPKRSGKIKFSKTQNWNIYKGSQWWALNEDFLRYTMTFLNSKNGKILKKEMKHLFAPDEEFFHTIFFNSNFRNTNFYNGEEAFPTQLYLNGAYKETAFVASFANLHLLHPSLDKVFALNDLPYIKERMKSPNILFIRKVRSENSELLIKRLNEKRVFRNDVSRY